MTVPTLRLWLVLVALVPAPPVLVGGIWLLHHGHPYAGWLPLVWGGLAAFAGIVATHPDFSGGPWTTRRPSKLERLRAESERLDAEIAKLEAGR